MCSPALASVVPLPEEVTRGSCPTRKPAKLPLPPKSGAAAVTAQFQICLSPPAA